MDAAQANALISRLVTEGRGEAAWWVVGQLVTGARELRAIIPAAPNGWDAQLDAVQAAYDSRLGLGANAAVVWGGQAAVLLGQAVEAVPAVGRSYVSTLLGNAMRVLGAPTTAVAAKPAPTTSPWLIAGAAVAAGFVLNKVFARRPPPAMVVTQVCDDGDDGDGAA